MGMYRGADESLARPGRKEATATEDFDNPIAVNKYYYYYYYYYFEAADNAAIF